MAKTYIVDKDRRVKVKVKEKNKSDAERLKEIRSSLKLTQEQLSIRLGIKQSTICFVERGTRQAPYTLKVALSNVFGIDFDGVESYEELMEMWHKSKIVIGNLKKELGELKEKLRVIEVGK